jgi:hypothetical protein
MELEDAGPALNAFLNAEAETYLAKVNARTVSPEAPELVRGYFLHLFEGLHSSRLRTWLGFSDEVQRFPDRSISNWQYQQQSIFRDPAFPWILPMSRTIRIGEVYLGIDKVSHFFGFGRRYYQRYLRLRAAGVPEQEAHERVIRAGIAQESSLVGGFVDGIFSVGDLEANYQGMRFAIALVNPDAPVFVQEGRVWRLARAIDIVPYITPYMDESWNVPYFTRLRKRQVPEIIRNEYCPLRHGEIVKARFARYAQYPKSLSQQLVEARFAAKEENPWLEQQVAAICAEGTRHGEQVAMQQVTPEGAAL